MRESRKYGSVRGALSNERPYRNRQAKLVRSSRCDLASAYVTHPQRLSAIQHLTGARSGTRPAKSHFFI
jgi:hypothetical protein